MLPTAKQRAAGGTPHRSQPWHTNTPAHTHTGRMCCSSDHAAREQRRSTLARTRSNAPFSRLLPTHPQAPANPSKSLHALPTPCSMRHPPFPQHKCTSRGEIEHERVDPNASNQPTQEKTTASAAGAPPATLKGEGGSRSFPEVAGRRDEWGVAAHLACIACMAIRESTSSCECWGSLNSSRGGRSHVPSPC